MLTECRFGPDAERFERDLPLKRASRVSRFGHFFRWTRHFGPDADRFSRDLRVLVVLKRASRAPDPDTFFGRRFNGLWASIQEIEELINILNLQTRDCERGR